MKRRNTIYSIITAVAALLSLVSCSDFLEVKPQNVTVEDEFWNEKADVDQMMTGLYASLQDAGVVKRMMIWGEFRSDNVTSGSNIEKDVSLQKIFKEDIDASNGYTTWTPFYYIINSANTLIEHAPAVAATDPAFSQSELNADIAEASAIRDLCYFYLIRTFRDVPYTTVSFADDNQVMNLPATKFDDVLDSLITDLEHVQDNAVKNYPSSSSTKALYQTGRITQDAIHAMLCDMYLWKKDYNKCIQYADMIIASMRQRAKDKGFYNKLSADDEARVNGYPLISDAFTNTVYGNAYTEIFGYGNSMESIFELTYMRDDNMPSNGAANDFYMFSKGDIVAGYAAPSTYVNGTEGQDNQVFSKYDGRYYENMNNGMISKGCFATVNVDYSGGTKNVIASHFSPYAEGKCKANWIIYRLSDVMLMKAEALTALMSNASELSDQDKNYMTQAFSLVNAVNKRSVCESVLKDTLKADDYATKEKIENLVMAERQRELMFEGKRWYDLVCRSRRDGNTDYLRQQTLMKFTSNTSAISGKLGKMDYIYWPYNIDELKVNSNLKQNPAFGSGVDESIEQNK
ncbi:MAG TPA: RagB/SusD family nutrient uptake outer membrane protein [Prevotella sp.]|nr:RagB/SusD family nutrient uptake outer membrane protein [Prevotella sp.]